jgi:hypothetical protein
MIGGHIVPEIVPTHHFSAWPYSGLKVDAASACAWESPLARWLPVARGRLLHGGSQLPGGHLLHGVPRSAQGSPLAR